VLDLAFFTDEVVREDFDASVRQGVEAGANATELRGGLYGKKIQDLSDADADRIAAVLQRHGARVAAISSPFGKCDPTDPKEVAEHHRIFERMAVLAHGFGTPVIRGFAFWAPARRKEKGPRPRIEDCLDQIVPLLRPAVEVARREGVILAFENEPATLVGTARDARVVIDALGGGPALGVAWDVRNGEGLGETAYPDGYACVRGLVRHVHVKPGREGGLGTLNAQGATYADVFRDLLRDGYRGAASIEHWGAPYRMLRGIRELRALLDRLTPEDAC
jgi:sugar phosphate isomerase/epimerase